ncbi:J domain-containing protein [Synechococcus sp. CS-1328]|uniref:J domain-containing protein n=1 Tax=Synechococcus sp. CS-1328 TaxID=2847976 RepID=UPI00223B080F|nr:J domain-containing protein [Synechococcus sp. CS-1328]MCT0226341.1 J domain-containing protein [Synechococcus sp. CS-1328]
MASWAADLSTPPVEPVVDSAQGERRRISLELPVELVAQIDTLRGEWGLRSRGDILVRLLQGLFEDDLPEGALEAVDLSGGSWTLPADSTPEEATEEHTALSARLAAAVRAVADSVVTESFATDNVDESSIAETSRDDAAVPPEALANAAAGSQPWTSPVDAQVPNDGIPAAEPKVVAGQRKEQPQGSGPQNDEIEDLEEEAFSTALDARGSLVLVPRRQVALRTTADPTASTRATPDAASASSVGGSVGGIDLPGFVQRRSDQLRRSLRVRPGSIQTDESLPTVPAVAIQQALRAAAQHWSDLYGSDPNEAVLEAAMVWLAQDIWPHADQSEGRAFTWSLASALVRGFAPSWEAGPASFERVMVMAGLLEDPFSAATLELRLPTLIRRFVHRFRRRRPGTSFLTLEHTMTLHGALKLLQLPTAPGHQLSLRQIRESYREMAVLHHPDSGGSVDAMRRLNEAYHLLKELYRGSS